MELDCFVDGFLEECPKQSVLEQFQRESVDVSFVCTFTFSITYKCTDFSFFYILRSIFLWLPTSVCDKKKGIQVLMFYFKEVFPPPRLTAA